MVIFGKIYFVRKFTASILRGREALAFKDTQIFADVQNPSDQSSKGTEGGRREPRIKAWTNISLQPEDQLSGAHADWIWYDEHWWKCM